MKLDKYHLEILNLLDGKYPKSLRKSGLMALLSNKNPKKFEREINYLKEVGLIEEKVGVINFSFVSIPFSFPFYKITAKGIDKLKEERITIPSKIREKVKRPLAFISASFNDRASKLIAWVRNRAENVEINTIWLKEIYQARPTIDKIDEAIMSSDCVIQILTSHIFEAGGEAGWVGNEIGMAFKSRPSKNIAVFVQKGYSVSGLAKFLTDAFPLDPRKLADYERAAEKYLEDLRGRIRIIDEE